MIRGSNEENTMKRIAVLSLAGVAAFTPSSAAQDMADVVVDGEHVAGHVYVITGRGGNIGLSVVLTEVAELTAEHVRFVVNTHWHGDHTGGNENLGKAGAVIVAHENVRRRMSTEQFNATFKSTTPASPEGALPVITFTDSVTFYWNDDELHVVHVDPAHTDGDSFIHFRKANVVHAGDLYFNGMYPYIDVGSGGSIAGMIDAADRILALCDRRTKIIPGHGEVSGVKALRDYRDMLQTVHGRMEKLVAEGKSRGEVLAAQPTADLDAEWGQGFMKPDVWTGIVYDSMTANPG
jgi:glyoxylase-like metal-dependent hydrolase (beta-lactamase superfamily II)